MWKTDQDGGPIYQQIIDRVKRQVATGQLAPGDRLPSARELAAEAMVNPNTVMRSFQELERQGMTKSNRGLGTFLREDLDVVGLRRELLEAASARFAAELQALSATAEEVDYAIGIILAARRP